MTLWNRENPPRLDRKPRANVLAKDEISALAQNVNARSRAIATGVLLLWNDYWDAAHEIAQSHEGEADHDLLHAILHRREGDFSNSNYWFRSAGSHPCFDRIATGLEPLLTQSHLREKLLANGTWNPRAFVDAVRLDKLGNRGHDEGLLRSIQAEEIIAFYEYLAR